MIILKAVLQINPDFTGQFQDLLPAFLATCRAEDGCLNFMILQDTEQAHRYIFLAEFVNEEALDFHEASAHVAHLKAQIGGWIVARTPAQLYHVDHIRQL